MLTLDYHLKFDLTCNKCDVLNTQVQITEEDEKIELLAKLADH